MRKALFTTPLNLALSLLYAAALSACGGGGDSSTDEAASSTDTSTAANATLVAGDATSALDVGVQTAQAVAAASITATAQKAMQAEAVANVPVACTGGGSATLTLTGGSAASVLNGQFDTGEVYALVFAECRRAAGAAAINGALTLTVQSASGTDLSLALVADDLTVALPRGSVTLAGSTTHEVSSSTDGNGLTLLSSHFSTPSLTLTTQFNARSSRFTLSAVDLTRQSTWLNGVPQSSSMSGTHTLVATLVNGAFSHTVSTQGSVSYTAEGLPSTGVWTITLPLTRVGVSVAAGVATLTVDEGKDGTIDRTITLPVGRLATAAG